MSLWENPRVREGLRQVLIALLLALLSILGYDQARARRRRAQAKPSSTPAAQAKGPDPHTPGEHAPEQKEACPCPYAAMR